LTTEKEKEEGKRRAPTLHAYRDKRIYIFFDQTTTRESQRKRLDFEDAKIIEKEKRREQREVREREGGGGREPCPGCVFGKTTQDLCTWTITKKE